MSERLFLLDTSALLTWLEGEEGTERVRELLQGADEVLVPWPVLMEAYYTTARIRAHDVALRRYAAVKRLPVTFLEQIEEPVLLTAARIKADYRVSIADAMIAAYAQRWHAVLVHKDPEYEALAEIVSLEALPYKRPD